MSDRLVWEIEGKDWPNRETSRFVEAGGVRWHVQVAGEGPVLLLIHGTGAATHSWRDLLPLLATHFTVVAPDLPGHGFTAKGPQTLPGMAGAVAALMAMLDLQPAFIVGHSAGGAIALRMVLDGSTARSIVALNPALLPFPGLAAQIFPTLAKLLFVNPFAPHIFARMAGPTREVARFMLKSTGSQLNERGIDLYARLFRKPGHIAGAIGMMANWDLETLKRDLPGLTTLAVLPALGHLAHEEAPDLIAAQIVERFGS
jgi:magnesium chelatase accessory protein